MRNKSPVQSTSNDDSLSKSGEQATFPGIKEEIRLKRLGKLDRLLSFFALGGGGKPAIAVLRLEGVIGKNHATIKPALNIACLNKLIEKAFSLDGLEAVALCINSPGGSPVQSELIAQRIISLAGEKQIPVYSFIEDVAASGGYWLAAAGNRIYASKSSIVGSIGVISSGFGLHEAIAKMGVERRVFTSGKSKSILDPFKPVKESDVALLIKIQQNIHEHFVAYVKSRRGGRLTQHDDILFTGEFWTGETALDFGLIDGIYDFYSFVRDHYGDDARIEYIENRQNWLKKRLGIGIQGYTENLAHEVTEAVVDTVIDKLSHTNFKLF